MPSVVFYVSGHGFGHASRDIEVINALLARRPDLDVRVRTTAARWLFDVTVRGRVAYEHVECDTGVVQHDSLTPDLEATATRAREFYETFDARVLREAAALRQLGARLVVGDVPPLAFAAAREAEIPSIALANFTWEWIYEDYAGWLGASAWIPGLIRQRTGSPRKPGGCPCTGGSPGSVASWTCRSSRGIRAGRPPRCERAWASATHVAWRWSPSGDSGSRPIGLEACAMRWV